MILDCRLHRQGRHFAKGPVSINQAPHGPLNPFCSSSPIHRNVGCQVTETRTASTGESSSMSWASVPRDCIYFGIKRSRLAFFIRNLEATTFLLQCGAVSKQGVLAMYRAAPTAARGAGVVSPTLEMEAGAECVNPQGLQHQRHHHERTTSTWR